MRQFARGNSGGGIRVRVVVTPINIKEGQYSGSIGVNTNQMPEMRKRGNRPLIKNTGRELRYDSLGSYILDQRINRLGAFSPHKTNFFPRQPSTPQPKKLKEKGVNLLGNIYMNMLIITVSVSMGAKISRFLPAHA